MKLNIRGMRESGFWSAGRFFPKEGVVVTVVDAPTKPWSELSDAERSELEAAGQITKSQLEQVRADSMFLAVEVPPEELDAKLAAEAKAKKN